MKLALERICDRLQAFAIGVSKIGNDGGNPVENLRCCEESFRARESFTLVRTLESFLEFFLLREQSVHFLFNFTYRAVELGGENF